VDRVKGRGTCHVRCGVVGALVGLMRGGCVVGGLGGVVGVNQSVESCSYSFTLCRVYIGNDD